MKRYLFLLVFFSAMALGVGAQNVSVNNIVLNNF